MAAPTSPQIIYNNPSFARYHERRGSTRRSSTLSRSTSQVESPRTLCPRDGGAFTYRLSHLSDWYVAQDLWERLPVNVRTHVATMQQAGAAVLTGCERLEEHRSELSGRRADTKFEEDELLAHLAALPPPKMRTTSNASSAVVSELASPVFTEAPNSELGSPSLASSQSTSPVSPICLGPTDALLRSDRPRERSFSTPLEPHDQRYALELSHLRTEALPRLRHNHLRVEAEWTEAKRINRVPDDDITTFEEWCAEKKNKIDVLYEKVDRLSRAINLSPNGLGWTAP
ncbi:hypothetical protein N0V90_006191 [Kalmusia sp. IMI 367209]|nr:hypothetical protein N0V90_006191 [Kalmusia sp. IMI 367209]